MSERAWGWVPALDTYTQIKFTEAPDDMAGVAGTSVRTIPSIKVIMTVSAVKFPNE
jgi:hypothetical protein